MAQINPSLPAINGARGDGEVALRADVVALLGQVNGNLDHTNMAPAFAAGPVEPIFSGYKLVAHGAAALGAGVVAATYLLGLYTLRVSTNLSGAGITDIVYIDPARFPGGTRSTRFRVLGTVVTNSVAPAATYAPKLYSVTGVGGASGASPTITSAANVTGGITSNIASPAASALTFAESSDFAISSAGWYGLAVDQTGTAAAGAAVNVFASLYVRQI